MLQRGLAYWAKVSGDKKRPVLVLSPEVRNLKASDVIVVPISSVLREGPWHVRLRRGEVGMSKASVIKCEQITTLHKDFIEPKPLGRGLSASKMAQVERAVLRAIGVAVPEVYGV